MFRAHRPIFRRVRTAVHTTIGSVSVPLCSLALCTQSTRTERHRNWTNGCVNSCTKTPEDGPVGPKHVETQQYTNKIVTSVGFHSICWKDARHKKLKIPSVSVALATQQAKRMCRLVVPYFSTVRHKRHDYPEKKLNIKYILTFTATFFLKYLSLRRLQWDMIKIHVKYPLLTLKTLN